MKQIYLLFYLGTKYLINTYMNLREKVNALFAKHNVSLSAEEVVEILDIPVVKSGRGRKPRVSAENAEVFLENVLEALPEPKAAGQGRGRSRRVSTANISTGEDLDGSLGEA